MTNSQERQGGSDSPDYLFDPVHVRYRHDGWTPRRQVAFIRALAACACVVEACRAVGMSPESAYILRARIGADSFRAAWDAALDHCVGRVADNAVGRAVNGVVTPIFYRGEQVGERRRYNDRLAMFLLRTRAPHRFGPPQLRPDEVAYAEATRHALNDAIERLDYDARREEKELRDDAEEFGLENLRGDDFRDDVSSISSTSVRPGAGFPDHGGAPGMGH